MVKKRKIPQRMCVGCKDMKIKKELKRIVRTPEGLIAFDPTGKRSGRGAYICPNEECLNQAIKGKRLQKALEVQIPNEVFEQLKNDIAK
ncbi:putative nucleic-acid-binding protein implicated in transcription termination [Candidatus Syntrophocurvum alkaliphilum]|uniref:Putative nucleic-acid-binding protein implicated in transcription termination n=1 Tax=Candidatus Syntrophocurvum alkaliphilum TaxID=2293317 RepID=A0A6I6DFP6_9FIRM|nr:YlxR family protein [Candidatus Syntrophocurvum alkaliphilum]QGT99211.1 putative nucleic-acid-binding protein implicated in transcription termination [Candidatus Syntrophocurvum alkaliphilum]